MIVRVSVVLNRTDVILTATDVSTTCAVVILLKSHFDSEDNYRTCTSEMTPGSKPFT